jgi:CDP-diacylglycerol--glycerol-3-phosphate 3-phosphatidyltransferase
MFPLNLPNVLTMMRILLVPVVVVALLDATPNGSILAAGVFALAAVTDGLDGYLARTRMSITNFGKVMDPIADKLLIAAALITLVSLERVEPWLAMVIIAREFAVSGLRVAAGQQGLVIPASPLGKLKTLFQIAAILAVIATSAWWAHALLYVAAVITIVSGADYFLNFRRRIEEARHRHSRDHHPHERNGGPPREPVSTAGETP